MKKKNNRIDRNIINLAVILAVCGGIIFFDSSVNQAIANSQNTNFLHLTLENTGTLRQKRALGIGTEFAELREYGIGDDTRSIRLESDCIYN
jgi:hypothetical protein